MEKRLVVFIVISFVIIFSYPFFISWLTGPSGISPNPPSKEEKADLPPETADLPPAASKSPQNLGRDTGEKREAAVPAPEVPTSSDEIEKVVESDLYRVTLSSLGGTIKVWQLKKYTEDNGEGAESPIQLVYNKGKRRPLTLRFSGDADTPPRHYQMDSAPLRLSPETPEGVVRMTYTDPEGRRIIKTLRFYHDQYRFDLNIEVEGYNQPFDLTLGTNFGIHEWGKQIGRSGGAIALIDTEIIQKTPKKMEEPTAVYAGRPRWVGLQDKYFISAIIPGKTTSVGPITFLKEDEREISAQVTIPREGETTDYAFMLYVGPKEYDRLNRLKVSLDESIDFGWFIFGSLLPVRMIAKPIFYLLRFFYQFTHNYGVAIILVTVLVKALFYPITRKSMISMKSMSSIQPKINAIRKQWANNKEKMNQELIKLYKTEKVNPLGGCLPMLIQIPVFISLFNILYTTIDLRKAPFCLWIQDLSAKDPYYVLPVVMGATMFIQQYTQPSTMDPAQAKMMLLLPIVYTFFFLNFPSGLVLYWLVNNSLTILQQYLLNKQGLSAAKIKAG